MRPPRVAMRARNPNFLFLLTLLGWYVRFIEHSPYFVGITLKFDKNLSNSARTSFIRAKNLVVANSVTNLFVIGQYIRL